MALSDSSMDHSTPPPTPFPVYAFVNQKGGCGKTTTAVNLAGALAARGDRVLLVDLDPQAHATLGLGCSPDRPTVVDVLFGEAPLAEAVVPAPGKITLLPSEPRLAEFEEAAGRTIHPEQKLKQALIQAMEDGTTFDHVVVDCSPRADGVLCANALFASTQAFLIVETGAFALQGAVQALKVLEDVADNQNRTFDVRVIGTMFDRRTKFARELLVALHGRFGGTMFNTVIRTSVRLREAPALGVPVQVLDPTCRAAEDFAELAEEVATLSERDVLVPQVAPSAAAFAPSTSNGAASNATASNTTGSNTTGSNTTGPNSPVFNETVSEVTGSKITGSKVIGSNGMGEADSSSTLGRSAANQNS